MKKHILIALALSLISATAFAETRTFNFAAVEVNGAKFWLPSLIIVKKGDHIKLHLMNKIPGKGSVHGFAIDEYKIKELVDAKGKDIEFDADEKGIFPIYCQLHPAHIGGELVVQ